MRANRFLFKLTPLACLAAASWPAMATNGMNMEGYGPISTAMGGASQAFDHGTAALAQNPATLALATPGARMDVALGMLGPHVASTMPGAGTAKSGGTSYVMPAFGYVRRSGALAYGIGVFAQGGMGTEYAANTWPAGGSGQAVRSELGVGRVLLPLAWQATPDLALGATLDFMWATLDMRMAVPGSMLGMAPNGLVTGGSGPLAQMAPQLGASPWVRIDFSDSNDFSGKASATGWAGKLGLVYRASPQLMLGASYQLKSSLRDMKTSASGASISACMGGAAPAGLPPSGLTCPAGSFAFTDVGRITVIDFQWPAAIAAGLAWQATPALMLAADVKRLDWADVMPSFRMRYDSAGVSMPGLSGSVSFALPQSWKNQTVLNLGAAYALNPALTLRAGLNMADNPIPQALVNALFPATVEKHYTLGLGWRMSPAGEFNGSLTVAPSAKVTNGLGQTITHRQTNVQLMYSHRF